MDLVLQNQKVCNKRIIYISDLHFDFVIDTTKENGHRHSLEFCERN